MERLVHEAIYLKRHPTLLERSEQLAAVTPARISGLLQRAVERATYLEGSSWAPLPLNGRIVSSCSYHSGQVGPPTA